MAPNASSTVETPPVDKPLPGVGEVTTDTFPSPGIQNGPIPPVEPEPPVPAGFVRLADVRPKQTGKDPYSPLRAFLGRMIQIDGIMPAEDKKSGTMAFSEFLPSGRPEGVDYPVFRSPVPRGAWRAILNAAQTRPDETICAKVVANKKGLALE